MPDPAHLSSPLPAGPLPAAPIPGVHRRLACLADVHGNTAALDAVLASAEFAGADAVVFLGCLSTGPEPLGVLDRCAALDLPAYYLAGNGERAVLELAAGKDVGDWPTGQWILERHGPRGLAELATWPAARTAAVHGLGPVRLCHGSPRSDIELLTPHTPEQRLRAATDGIDERTVVHGHTHLQYDRAVAGLRVLSPGSVGMPYHDGEPGARWAILGPDVELVITGYPVEEAERRSRALGYPSDTYLHHLRTPPTPVEIIADAEAREFSD